MGTIKGNQELRKVLRNIEQGDLLDVCGLTPLAHVYNIDFTNKYWASGEVQ